MTANSKTTKSTSKTGAARRLTGIAMLSAVAFALQFLEFPIPIMPAFIKLDFSDLPELLAAFAYGPLAGVAVAGIKNLIHLPLSSSMYVGELSNFLLGAVLSVAAGAIYKKHKTKRGALGRRRAVCGDYGARQRAGQLLDYLSALLQCAGLSPGGGAGYVPGHFARHQEHFAGALYL